MHVEADQPAYENTVPNEQGPIRLKMPNLDPAKEGEFFCITLGTEKEAVADAMCQWLSIIDYGECH